MHMENDADTAIYYVQYRTIYLSMLHAVVVHILYLFNIFMVVSRLWNNNNIMTCIVNLGIDRVVELTDPLHYIIINKIILSRERTF